MEKKILLINGSPRKNGMTNALVDIFIEKIQQLKNEASLTSEVQITAEKCQLVEYKVQYCTACDSCLRKPNECPQSATDDMGKLEEKLLHADAIIICSPSYFANVSGLVKNLIDRTRPLKMAKYRLKNKYFSVMVTSGLRAGGLNSVQDVLIQYALIQGMVVVGALGHPVLMANLPTEVGQKLELSDFRKPSEVSAVSRANVESLAIRFWELLS